MQLAHPAGRDATVSLELLTDDNGSKIGLFDLARETTLLAYNRRL